jgi:hypothetical protein
MSCQHLPKKKKHPKVGCFLKEKKHAKDISLPRSAKKKAFCGPRWHGFVSRVVC